MNVTIIGLGLIGGSMAMKLKKEEFAAHITGVDTNDTHCRLALEFGLVDEIKSLDESLTNAHLIIVSIPVDATKNLLPDILDKINIEQKVLPVIMDTGSAKNEICNAVENHKNRSRFVASHPMWGTEKNGPQAAIISAFANKGAVICNKEQSDDDATALVEKIYSLLGMHTIYMDSASHDVHVAYISHVSHITSFALANTVLEKEKEDDKIFELASGGFESTARLAKSNAAMWVPIFKQNKDNVLDVLNEHITQLRKFKSFLEKENYEELGLLITQANTIKRILK